MVGGIAVNSLGHSDHNWVKVVVKQVGTLMHVNNIYYLIPQVTLGKRLVDCSFADCLFINSGTEANEAAIKFARKFQKSLHSSKKQLATEFISFTNCFHGWTMGALTLMSKGQYRTPFEPLMPGATFLECGNLESAVKLYNLAKQLQFL